MNNDTLNYYEKNADVFASGTVDVVFTDIQDKFLKLLPKGGYILDFGCGSGRDTKYFLGKGFRVDAVDGSERLCRIASGNAGIDVRQMLFSELEADEVYDGIWACASILHLPRKELEDVFKRMLRAVRHGGYIYASFKYGEFEGFRNGRFFTDFTEKSFEKFASFAAAEFVMVDEWVTADVRPGRGDERWLNLILRKCTVS